MPGVRLGQYEVLSALGAGGMGEVFRARDTRLNRDVALKVLPDVVARDRERLARFEREAQLLAALNHPRIAAIYRFEETDGVCALVLELVEGPTLADRVARGPLAIDEALAIAGQLADALAAAHEKGIVHRDLKPANIKIASDGTVKVLDFGLAKALEDPRTAGDALSSPAITSPAATRGGVILGTAAYMSPEQARGHAVGTGADIWAFGCVLFEMLTGGRAFPGDDVSDILAAILRGEPDWARLPAATPNPIRRLLRRCLAKDRARRLSDIRDARLDIDDASGAGDAAVPAFGSAQSRWRERVLWGAAIAVLAVGATLGVRRGGRPPASDEMRVDIVAPPTTDPASFAISPDGQKIVVAVLAEARPQLWVRSIASGAVRVLQGTDGATFPFWAPDSRSIAFFANERLNRIDADGGMPKPIASSPVGTGGTWNRDGVILFTTVPDAPIARVSENGGAVEFLPGEGPGGGPQPAGQRFPQFFPDGRRFVYYVAELHAVFVGQIDSPERRRLVDADAAALFLPPSELLFVRDGTLFAQRVDVEKAVLIGDPRPLADHVGVDARGIAAVSASNTGAILYRAGVITQERQLLLVDRSGQDIRTIGQRDAAYPINPTLSPDGRTLAITRSVKGNTDVWLVDLDRDTPSRFTFDTVPEIYPTWSPDGRRLAYAKPDRPRGFNVFVKPVGEAAGAGTQYPTSDSAIPLDWSRDGQFLLCRMSKPSAGWRLVALPLAQSVQPIEITHANFDEKFGQFSPDGKWVSYESTESGRPDIFVQSFPDGQGKTQVSTGGGSQGLWRADGREFFYISTDGQLMAVPVRPRNAGAIEFGTPARLFPIRVESMPQGGVSHQYVPSADGQRFLMSAFVEQQAVPLTLILNHPR